jgi:hypothetical protein
MDTNKDKIRKLLHEFIVGQLTQTELENELTLMVGAPVKFGDLPPPPMLVVDAIDQKTSIAELLGNPLNLLTTIEPPMHNKLDFRINDLAKWPAEPFVEYKKDPEAKIPFYDGLVKKRKKR